MGALRAGDMEAFGPLPPLRDIPYHNLYEVVWFFKTGLPRIVRVLLGKERFVKDKNILREGYQHYTP